MSSNNRLMSIQLVDECSKRLSMALNQMKKVLSLYDSKEMDSLIYQSAKTEGVYNQVKDNVKLQKMDYQSKSTIFREMNYRLAQENTQPSDKQSNKSA